MAQPYQQPYQPYPVSAPPSEYNYQSAPQTAQQQQYNAYGGYGVPQYGTGVRHKRDDCCGCTRKSCIIIIVVSTVVFLVVLTLASVGIYFAVQASANAYAKSTIDKDNDKDDDGVLSCDCNTNSLDCKNKSPTFQVGKMICKTGQECYAYDPDEIFDSTIVECRENPGKYKCKRDEDKKVNECWCNQKSKCINNIIGCTGLCRNGTKPNKRRR